MSVGNIVTEDFLQLIMRCMTASSPAILPRDLISYINKKTDTCIGITPIHVQHLVVLGYTLYREYLVEYDRHARLLCDLFESGSSNYSEIIDKMQIIEDAVLHNEVQIRHLNTIETIVYDEAYISLCALSLLGEKTAEKACIQSFLRSIDASIKSNLVDSLIEISINEMFPDARLHTELKFTSNWKIYAKKSGTKIALESKHFAHEYWYRVVEPIQE